MLPNHAVDLNIYFITFFPIILTYLVTPNHVVLSSEEDVVMMDSLPLPPIAHGQFLLLCLLMVGCVIFSIQSRDPEDRDLIAVVLMMELDSPVDFRTSFTDVVSVNKGKDTCVGFIFDPNHAVYVCR